MVFGEELKQYHADAPSISVIHDYQITDVFTIGSNISTHTRFQAASISKMVFTLSVLCLVAQNKISLDDDGGKYIAPLYLKNSNGLLARATVRQILSHTAGFGVSGFDGYGRNVKLPTTEQIILGEFPCNSPKIIQEYIPGKHCIYSGGGFIILQKCIENISGMPFADFMEQTVLYPLDMTDSTFRQNITENIVEGYFVACDRVSKGYNFMPEQAAAGLWTTASDLARFGIHHQNILRGKTGLVPQMLVQEMIRPQHREILDLDNIPCKTGLGCYLQYIHDAVYFGHSGRNCGFESQINFSVQNGKGCCILANSDDIFPLIEKIQDYFLGSRPEEWIKNKSLGAVVKKTTTPRLHS